MWLGDTSTGNTNPNTNKFDGIIKIADNASLGATYTYTDASTSKSKVLIDTINLLPKAAYEKGEVVAYVGRDFYDNYIQELMANGNLVINLSNGFDSIGQPDTIIVPGTRVRVIPVNGLNGTKRVFISYKDNFIYGTDMEGDNEKVEFWYSQDNREFRLAIEFTAGAQIAFPDMLAMAKANA